MIIRGCPNSESWSGGDAEAVRSRMQQDLGKVGVSIPREWVNSVSWSRSDAETYYFLVRNVSMASRGLNESRMVDSRVSEWERGRHRLLQSYVSNHMCRILGSVEWVIAFITSGWPNSGSWSGSDEEIDRSRVRYALGFTEWVKSLISRQILFRRNVFTRGSSNSVS